MQLNVVKTDGSIEEYLHTKVVGTISNALSYIEQESICTAEQLADVVTYFIYHEKKQCSITSGEIFSMIKTVLATTGYENAAITLEEHHFERKLKRSRIEVISIDIQQLSDAKLLYKAEGASSRCRWDKSRIVTNLVTKHNVCGQTARMIASIVEERIFSIGFTLIPVSLIKQLVLGDAAVVLRAEQQLQSI